MKITFQDFKNKPEELIGKLVLYKHGTVQHTTRSIMPIEKVTKTGFRLASMPDTLFSLTNGTQKGLNSRMDWNTISTCTLITDDEADEYRASWKTKREEKLLREELRANLDFLTYEQLKKINELL